MYLVNRSSVKYEDAVWIRSALVRVSLHYPPFPSSIRNRILLISRFHATMPAMPTPTAAARPFPQLTPDVGAAFTTTVLVTPVLPVNVPMPITPFPGSTGCVCAGLKSRDTVCGHQVE
jgi:hypothetical protein